VRLEAQVCDVNGLQLHCRIYSLGNAVAEISPQN
jgi:hypothetical protein